MSGAAADNTPDDGRVLLTARHAVAICTGSRPAIPDLPGIAEARPWTNREATDSHAVPGRLAIVGGGGVGVEMASAWQSLGASVTLLARGTGLLPRMEPFAGELVARGLADAGVDVRIGVTVTGVRRPGGTGPITLLLDDGGEREADEVLFATGRSPLTDDIGLQTVGLTPGSWGEVDDTCQVLALNDGWLYAVGDVNHRALLTHQGKYQARVAGNAIGARAAGRPLDTVPWGAHVTTADSHIGANLYADGYRGRVRMVVDLDHGYLLGVTFVGPGVDELLHSATIAVAGQVPLDRLWHAVPCFPTISEVWLRLLEAYRG